MRILLVVTVAITAVGLVLLGWMFARDDSRLGMAGLATMITADITAMVYAALNQ